MITVISGTNRKDAKTHVFAQFYADALRSKIEEVVHYISLEEIQESICLLYTSPSPRDGATSRMPSSA